MDKFTNGPVIILKYAVVLVLAFVISTGVFHTVFADFNKKQTGGYAEWKHNTGVLGDWDCLFAKTKDSDMIVSEEKQDSADAVSGHVFTDTVSGHAFADTVSDVAYEGRT